MLVKYELHSCSPWSSPARAGERVGGSKQGPETLGSTLLQLCFCVLNPCYFSVQERGSETT